nr:MAG TPA: hypothetical protein [Bacteriophage sp.]
MINNTQTASNIITNAPTKHPTQNAKGAIFIPQKHIIRKENILCENKSYLHIRKRENCSWQP